jgi:hypothetical protein
VVGVQAQAATGRGLSAPKTRGAAHASAPPQESREENLPKESTGRLPAADSRS